MNAVLLKKIIFEDINLITPKLIEAAKLITSNYSHKTPRVNVIYYLNAHTLNLMLSNTTFKRVYKKATAVYIDGWGAVWIAKIAGIKCPERITTMEFFYDFCEICEKKNLKIFLLGGTKSTIDSAVRNLNERFPKIKIVGYYHGYFSNSKAIITKINQTYADFLLVGMGSPKQELWLNKYQHSLEVTTCWSVGSMFEYVAKDKLKAPDWLGNFHLEWLFRLSIEPKRLWKRYLIDLPLLTIKIFYLILIKK